MAPPPARPRTKKVPGPRYDLAKEVLPKARTAYLGAAQSVHRVQSLLGLSRRDAERFVFVKLTSLTTDNYVETVEMQYTEGTVVADVHGLTDLHGGWYFKYFVQVGQVQVVSCHPPLHPLLCIDGTTVK